VRQAIYDGPVDLRGYTLQPVILERIPETSNGDALLQPVQVISNTLVATSQGTLANLAEGVSYQPSGCYQAGCAQTYTGTAPASLDQLVVRFRMRPGLLWSDGTPLTASDSVFAFETAKALYPRLRPELIDFTASYQALDEVTVEWRGVPGYKDPLYQTDFFVPMPRHLWGKIPPLDLFSDEAVNRTPIGWGPYIIDEWKAGDHITLHKNPNYFRHGEGLPAFDNLVYRFVGDGEAALSALLAGECDVLDESALNNVPHQRLLDLQTEGKLKLSVEPGMAWEHADFDLAPIDPARLNLFQSKDLRQAIALCIDRGALVKALFFGKPVTLNTFVPPSHPLYNPQARTYDYNPQQAQSMLTAAGWIDTDGNPQTARVAQGILKIPDGTPLAFTYQTLGGGERQQAAQMIRDELAQCGIQLNLEFGEREALFAPGPDGPVFGRNYDMAQFAWPTAMQPTCSLYTTDEIPGPYPQFPKGWGGANNTGYSNPAYDQACRQARSSLPDSPVYAEAQRQAQAIFAEDLPAIPLYVHLTWIAMRPDLCGVDLQTPVENTFWNLEKWDYGEKVTCDS
jgi:peptide/nickel transport system substrate-binding protein